MGGVNASRRVILKNKAPNNQLDLKRVVAKAALAYVDENSVIGVGTGSTVQCFIEALAESAIPIKAAVASSKMTAHQLQQAKIPVVSLNDITELPVYIDGTDEINRHLAMIKGHGAALTGEKIVAQVAQRFICIADKSKYVEQLGKVTSLPIEVIPMARSFVARKLVALGGTPVYRQGTVTDYGNVILDVYGLPLRDLDNWETALNQLAGVVTHGLFVSRRADLLLLAGDVGVEYISRV